MREGRGLNRWTILAVLFLARTAMGYQFQSVASVSPFLIEALAIDFALLGTLIGLFKLPGIVLSLPAGALGRRFGDKALVLFGLGVMAVGGVLLGAAETYATAVVARLLSGIGGVLLNIYIVKMVMDWFEGREMVLAMAIIVNSWPFGIAVALVTQGGLAVALDWPAVPYATALVALVAFVLIWLAYRPLVRAKDETLSTGPGRLGRDELIAVSVAALAWSLFNVGLILVVSFGLTYLTAAGFSLSEAGWLVSLGTWLGVITIPLGGYVAQRWHCSMLVMVACLSAGALSCWALIASASPLLPLLAFGVLAWAPAGSIMALASEALRPQNRALGMGIFYTWYYALMGVLPAVGGYLRDVSGDAGAPIVFAGVMFLAALAFVGLSRLKILAMAQP